MSLSVRIPDPAPGAYVLSSRKTKWVAACASVLLHLAVLFPGSFPNTKAKVEEAKDEKVVPLYIPPVHVPPHIQKATVELPKPSVTPPITVPKTETAQTQRGPVDPDDVEVQMEIPELRDPAGQIEPVLAALHGLIAFGPAKQEGRFTQIFEAPEGTAREVSGPYVPSSRFCSYTMTSDWPLADRIGRQNGVPGDSIVHIAFDRSVCAVLRAKVRQFASERGIACVTRAVGRYDSSSPDQFSIMSVEACAGKPAAR